MYIVLSFFVLPCYSNLAKLIFKKKKKIKIMNCHLLAHLSRRLIGELIIWQGCCLSLCRVFTYSNVFSSGTTGPIEVKFHVEPSWDRGTKVWIWGLGHMTNMAAMSINGKNSSKIFFSGTARPICMKLGM